MQAGDAGVAGWWGSKVAGVHPYPYPYPGPFPLLLPLLVPRPLPVPSPYLARSR